MSLDKDDIRAAVAANILSEPQAASLMALADSRRGTRENMDGLDEPFELFRGFNEIFIVVGLVILFAGWQGTTGVSSIMSDQLGLMQMIYGALGMAGTIALAGYFTKQRRMVAPSIALVIFFALSSGQVAGSLASLFDLGIAFRTAFTAAMTALALIGYYALFRVPITMPFIAISVFVGTGALFVLGGANTPALSDIFKLTADGPFAIITIVLGLACLAVAMRFDMSDPHRVTRRASAGFWLHVVAAPAIVNTIALTLFETGGAVAQSILLVFLAAMAVFAIIIDRRSFLVAGIGYILALGFVVLDGNAVVVMLILGVGLVWLGAKWEAFRARIMTALPRFPGKDRLPPWGLTETSL